MSALSLNDVAILATGLGFIAAGLAGLAVLLLHSRLMPTGGFSLNGSMALALGAAATVVRPAIPATPAVQRATPQAPTPVSGRAVLAPAEAPVLGRLGATDVPVAEELLARLFNIRLTLSEVAAEVHTLRDARSAEDDEIVEDIDDIADDLSDIDQDEYPETKRVSRARAKVREAA